MNAGDHELRQTTKNVGSGSYAALQSNNPIVDQTSSFNDLSLIGESPQVLRKEVGTGKLNLECQRELEVIVNYIQEVLLDYDACYLHIIFEDLVPRAAMVGKSNICKEAPAAVINSANAIVAANAEARKKGIVPLQTSMQDARLLLPRLVLLNAVKTQKRSLVAILNWIASSFGSLVDVDSNGLSYRATITLQVLDGDPQLNLKTIQSKIWLIESVILDEVGFPALVGFGHSQVIASIAAKKQLPLDITFKAGIDADVYQQRLMEYLDLTDFPDVSARIIEAVLPVLGDLRMKNARANLPLLFAALNGSRPQEFRMIASLCFGADQEKDTSTSTLLSSVDHKRLNSLTGNGRLSASSAPHTYKDSASVSFTPMASATSDTGSSTRGRTAPGRHASTDPITKVTGKSWIYIIRRFDTPATLSKSAVEHLTATISQDLISMVQKSGRKPEILNIYAYHRSDNLGGCQHQVVDIAPHQLEKYMAEFYREKSLELYNKKIFTKVTRLCFRARCSAQWGKTASRAPNPLLAPSQIASYRQRKGRGKVGSKMAWIPNFIKTKHLRRSESSSSRQRETSKSRSRSKEKISRIVREQGLKKSSKRECPLCLLRFPHGESRPAIRSHLDDCLADHKGLRQAVPPESQLKDKPAEAHSAATPTFPAAMAITLSLLPSVGSQPRSDQEVQLRVPLPFQFARY